MSSHVNSQITLGREGFAALGALELFGGRVALLMQLEFAGTKEALITLVALVNLIVVL